MLRLLSIAVVLVLGSALQAQDPTSKPTSAADALHPLCKMETTLGDITLELDAEKAPISVLNFVKYAEDGFYNGTIFHRVMSGFMIQGGGFTSDMDQKSDLRPPIKNEWQNGLKNDRGTIAMARTGAPDSATSQFFINVVDNAKLDKPRGGAAYAVFGKVVEGMDTVDKIRDTAVAAHPKYGGGRSKVVPVEPVIIKSLKLVSEFDRSSAELQAAKAIAEAAQAAEAAKAEAAKAAEEAKAANQEKITKAVAEIESETGKKMITTSSGLRYVTLKEATGDVSPKPTDKVEVHYTGWLLDGTKFDSSVDRGKPSSFRLNGVIKGWTEGLGLMKVGQKCKFLIPSDLAYGPRRKSAKIGPNEVLIFDVELLAIK